MKIKPVLSQVEGYQKAKCKTKEVIAVQFGIMPDFAILMFNF